MGEPRIEPRSIEVQYRRAGKDGPHYVVKYMLRGLVQGKAAKFSLGKIADVIHNWIHNGFAAEGEAGLPTPVDSQGTKIVVPKEEADEGDRD